MGNQQSNQNSRLIHQGIFNQQANQKNHQKLSYSNSTSNLNFSNEFQKKKKIPLSQKYSKICLNQNQTNSNKVISRCKAKKIDQKDEVFFQYEQKGINFNLKQNKNKYSYAEQGHHNFKILRQQAINNQFCKKYQENSNTSLEQSSTNSHDRNPDLIPLQYFINRLKICSATYALKTLIQSYYQIYVVHDEKVIVSLYDCYVNQLGQLIVFYRQKQQINPINTPPVLDYSFNFVSVIYKVFQIVQELIKDTQKDLSQNGYKVENLYQKVVQLIHYCKQTQNKSIHNVQNRMYKKIMNQIQNFIQQNHFKQNLLKDLLSFKKNQSIKSSIFHGESLQKINQKSKNTKSSDYQKLSQTQSRFLKQAIQKQLNKNSDLKIKNIVKKSQNTGQFSTILNQVNEQYKKNNQKRHKRNATQNNVNRSSDLKVKQNLYTQTNETFNMKNITERFQQVQSQYSYVNDMNASQNRNFKKPNKYQFSGRQYTQPYQKINKNNINYQYAINIINTNFSSNTNQIKSNQISQKNKEKKKNKQKKLVAFKQASQGSGENISKEQNKPLHQIKNQSVDQKHWKKIKYQTSIDKLPENCNPYYITDGFKQNMDESIFRGQTTLDNKLQRSRLEMMARQVQVRNGTHPQINFSSNTIGTEFKF